MKPCASRDQHGGILRDVQFFQLQKDVASAAACAEWGLTVLLPLAPITNPLFYEVRFYPMFSTKSKILVKDLVYYFLILNNSLLTPYRSA
jgi:hypothetical protein